LLSDANPARPIRTGEERAHSNDWNCYLRVPLPDEGSKPGGRWFPPPCACGKPARTPARARGAERGDGRAEPPATKNKNRGSNGLAFLFIDPIPTHALSAKFHCDQGVPI